MAKISVAALREVEVALERFAAEVRASQMTAATQKTYLLHATNFVRWLDDEFSPGDRLRGRH